MRKFFLTIIVFIFLLGCESEDPYKGEYIDLSFEEKQRFGQPDSLSESTLHFATDVRLGPDNNIYVADAGVAKVKVYSPTGQLVNSFGKRGRGPGELTGIKGFAVTDSTVLVWDQSLQRISVFGLDGKFQSVHKIKGTPYPMRIHSLEDSFLALHGDKYRGKNIRETKLGHIYPADFSRQKESFIKLGNTDDRIESLPRVLKGWTGHVLVLNNQRFLYVPFLANGKIYQFEKTSDGWQQSHIYESLNQQQPYSFIENENERKADGKVSAIDLSEDKQYVAHNWSRGLLTYQGYIFHFTFSDIGDTRVFGVEIYDKNINPIGYVPIKSIPITDKEDNFLSWYAEDVDENGNFYILQRNNKGTKVRVMQINHQDLKTLSD